MPHRDIRCCTAQAQRSRLPYCCLPFYSPRFSSVKRAEAPKARADVHYCSVRRRGYAELRCSGLGLRVLDFLTIWVHFPL